MLHSHTVCRTVDLILPNVTTLLFSQKAAILLGRSILMQCLIAEILLIFAELDVSFGLL